MVAVADETSLGFMGRTSSRLPEDDVKPSFDGENSRQPAAKPNKSSPDRTIMRAPDRVQRHRKARSSFADFSSPRLRHVNAKKWRSARPAQTRLQLVERNISASCASGDNPNQ
jgi:hypothetical protein